MSLAKHIDILEQWIHELGPASKSLSLSSPFSLPGRFWNGSSTPFDVMVKIVLQGEKAKSGHKMASIIFGKEDISFLKEMIQKNPKGFYLSNIRILKDGEKV